MNAAFPLWPPRGGVSLNTALNAAAPTLHRTRPVGAWHASRVKEIRSRWCPCHLASAPPLVASSHHLEGWGTCHLDAFVLVAFLGFFFSLLVFCCLSAM